MPIVVIVVLALLYYRARTAPTATATDATPPDTTFVLKGVQTPPNLCGEAMFRPPLQNPDTKPGAWPGLPPAPQPPFTISNIGPIPKEPPPQIVPPFTVSNNGPIPQEPPPIVATPLPLKVPITSPPAPPNIFTVVNPIISVPPAIYRPLQLTAGTQIDSSPAPAAGSTATGIRETPMDIFL